MSQAELSLREPFFARLLSFRVSLEAVFFAAFLLIYAALAIVLFYSWVNPTLVGYSNAHVAADSGTYMYFADSLRNGNLDPFVVASLASFPNTRWVPVFLSFVLKDTTTIALFNCGLFIYCVYLIKRGFPTMNLQLFTALLLMNATTFISLLAVNKEIIDLLVISMFCYSRATGRRLVLVASLVVALLNRYEVCVMLLLFLFLDSRFRVFSKRRALTLVSLVVLFTILLPTFAIRSLSQRFEEVQQIGHEGALVLLDNLEMHFGFFVVMLPKLIQVMFGEILALPSRWPGYSMDDAANTYIVLLNNLANVLVIVVLLWKRTLTIKSDLIYLVSVCAIVVSSSIVVQPRYFYLCFVVLCIQAAHSKNYLVSFRRPS